MAKILSIVDYIHELKEAGFTDKQAEVQARRLELAVSEVEIRIKDELKNQELATKKDLKELELNLKLVIEKIRYEALRFIIWTGVAVIVAIGSMLAKGFHWL